MGITRGCFHERKQQKTSQQAKHNNKLESYVMH